MSEKIGENQLSIEIRLKENFYSKDRIHDELRELYSSSMTYHDLLSKLETRDIKRVVITDNAEGFGPGMKLSAGIALGQRSTEINHKIFGTVYVGLNPEFVAYDKKNKRFLTVAEQIVHGLVHHLEPGGAREHAAIRYENDVFVPMGFPEKSIGTTTTVSVEDGMKPVYCSPEPRKNIHEAPLSEELPIQPNREQLKPDNNRKRGSLELEGDDDLSTRPAGYQQLAEVLDRIALFESIALADPTELTNLLPGVGAALDRRSKIVSA